MVWHVSHVSVSSLRLYRVQRQKQTQLHFLLVSLDNSFAFIFPLIRTGCFISGQSESICDKCQFLDNCHDLENQTKLK